MHDDKVLKDAQYRKNLSIAYFNATNSAIEMVKFEKPKTPKQRMIRLEKWRAYFLDAHQKHYANVIAKIGSNYDALTTIAKLKKVKTMAELKNTWLFLSEDERHDQEIIKVKDKLKAKYEKVL